MKLKSGKKCRIYGEMDNVRVVRVSGRNVIVRGKNGQCRAVSAKNLRDLSVKNSDGWLELFTLFLLHKPTK